MTERRALNEAARLPEPPAASRVAERVDRTAKGERFAAGRRPSRR